jgi:hypothetical protein
MIGVMSLFVILAVVTILSNVGILAGSKALTSLILFFPLVLGISNSIFTVAIPGVHYLIIAAVSIAAAVFEIYLCVNIYRQKKWAFGAYAWVIALGGVMRIITDAVRIGAMPGVNVVGSIVYSITPFLIKGFLLIVVYMVDGKHYNKISSREEK